MKLRNYILVSVLLGITTLIFPLQAQHFDFSEDPEKFHLEVFEGLQQFDVEAVRKIASDFRDNWPRMTAEQKNMIIKNAVIMRKRRLQTRPFFTYYFGYITYAVEQAGLPSDQLTKLLEINTKLINTYNNRDLLRFYADMNFLMGRNYLYRHHYNSLKFSGGSYEFEYIEPAGGGNSFGDPAIEDFSEDPVAEDEFLTQEDIEEQATDDDWGNDDWADTDTESDDGWADPDSWGNDPWADTDTWGAQDDTDAFADSDQDSGWGDTWDSPQDPWAEEQEEATTTWSAEEEANIFDGEYPDLQSVRIDVMNYLKADEQRPVIEGPVIHFKNIDLEMASIYDSIGIENATGTYLIKERIFIGETAKVKWPGEIPGTDGAYATLEDYFFKGNVPYVRAIQSKLTFSEFFEGEVDGFFLFKSIKRNKRNPPRYPRFKSHHADVTLKIPAKRLAYYGGISLNGGQMTGENVAGENSRIEVLDGKGRSFVAYSPAFIFGDSVITAAETDITIYHGDDSIHHPKVRFKYDYGREILTLIEPDNGFKYMPYYSSYFDMVFNVDLVKWDLKTDSLNFSIMNGSDLVPAIFESVDYFHPNRIDRFTGLYRFNPVVAVVNYARKIKKVNYYVGELADFYETDLKVMQSAMKSLSNYGLIKYQPVSGEIIVLPMANHYYLSNLEKVDYDHLLVSSTISALPNATLKLDSGQLKVRGVERVLLTHNEKVYLEPENEEITILKDRNLKFDGAVWSGDFEYKGQSFGFDYDKFLLDLAQVDSIRIQIPVTDSTNLDDYETVRGYGDEKVAVKNHLTNTAGTLYIDNPENKSGLKDLPKFPYFVSTRDATVSFNSPDILGGAYDSTFRFSIPPFEIDSLQRDDLSKVAFEGTFDAGGIIEPIEEKLRIMPDKSFGFTHDIAEGGYNLYGDKGKVYNKLRLDGQGLRADGKIEHLTADLNSEDFVFYPDSVVTVGTSGALEAGTSEKGSFPQADFGEYKMKWLPEEDSMYIANIGEPMNLYNETATLDGEVNITDGAVYGEGLMNTRGSEIVSKEMVLAEKNLSARHAEFAVLTDNPEKPAMQGDDVSLEFDLTKNIAEISPEKTGVAAIGFPYAQMKTSITDAIWDLSDSTITMSKADNISIEDSYFFTTRPELDSLAFNAEAATYDINTKALEIEGIPYIIVADAKITPDGGKTTILENAELEPFTNATIVIDTLNEYHRLFNGQIKILSRNKFEGKATYQLVNAAQDSFAIEFEEFQLQEVARGKRDTKLMTVSGGTITEENDVIISPGFQYRGRVTMFADQQALDMKGFVQPILPRPDYQYWIEYVHEAESPEVEVNFNTALTETGQKINAGLFLGEKTGELYTAFLEDKRSSNDIQVFEPSGMIKYLLEAKSFGIEDPMKSDGTAYAGRTMIYNPNQKTLLFEGPMNMIANDDDYSLETSVLGQANITQGDYTIDAMMLLSMNIGDEEHELMTYDIIDIIERLGAPAANTADANELYKLANIIGDQATKSYEKKAIRSYTPLYTADNQLEKTIAISTIEMKYSQEHKAWYNTSTIGLSHLFDNDVNASIDGFMEIKKDEFGDDVVNLFLQVAAGTWYYFNYEGGRLMMFSSNSEFNTIVEAKSDVSSVGFGQYATVNGDISETLKYINSFREKYFGITEPYDLQSPDEIFLEDENFETIKKEKDGFGF